MQWHFSRVYNSLPHLIFSILKNLFHWGFLSRSFLLGEVSPELSTLYLKIYYYIIIKIFIYMIFLAFSFVEISPKLSVVPSPLTGENFPQHMLAVFAAVCSFYSILDIFIMFSFWHFYLGKFPHIQGVASSLLLGRNFPSQLFYI